MGGVVLATPGVPPSDLQMLLAAPLTPQQASYLDEVMGMLGAELTEGEFDLVLECERRRLPTVFSLGQIRKARGLPAV